jgi:LysM repeat protein
MLHPVRHQVLSGESFYDILQKYNVSTAQLISYNPGLINKRVVEGEWLYIPSCHHPKPCRYSLR